MGDSWIRTPVKDRDMEIDIQFSPETGNHFVAFRKAGNVLF